MTSANSATLTNDDTYCQTATRSRNELLNLKNPVPPPPSIIATGPMAASTST